MIVENLIQNTAEWLEFRKNKFNASETPSVMGDGFLRPYQLAEIKYKNGENFQNDAMRRGQEYEPKIREILSTIGKFEPCVMVMDEDERFSASLDGYDAKQNIICEIKFSKEEADFLKYLNEPSKKYQWQIQHQLMVSKAKKCIFAVGYIDENLELVVEKCEVKPDKKAWKKIVEAWENFEEAYKNDLIDDEFKDINDELVELTAKQKELDERIKELKERAIEKANGKEAKVLNLTIYQMTRKGGFDYKAYCEANNITPSDEFKKADTSSWAIRVNI